MIKVKEEMQNDMIKVKIVKLSADVDLPARGSDGAGCYDVKAYIAEGTRRYGITMCPGDSHIFNTGLRFEIPAGYTMMAYSRSGHGFKNDVCLTNSVGIIDNDYRGEMMCKLINHSDELFVVRHGDKICQIRLERNIDMYFAIVESLGNTCRGTRGFGSTG